MQAKLLVKVRIPNNSQCALVLFEAARAIQVTSHVR